MGPQQEVPVRGLIQVAIMPNGQIEARVQGQGISLIEALGALEMAKGLILARQQEDAKKPKIMMANPALAAALNGQR